MSSHHHQLLFFSILFLSSGFVLGRYEYYGPGYRELLGSPTSCDDNPISIMTDYECISANASVSGYRSMYFIESISDTADFHQNVDCSSEAIGNVTNQMCSERCQPLSPINIDGVLYNSCIVASDSDSGTKKVSLFDSPYCDGEEASFEFSTVYNFYNSKIAGYSMAILGPSVQVYSDNSCKNPVGSSSFVYTTCTPSSISIDKDLYFYLAFQYHSTYKNVNYESKGIGLDTC